MNNFQVRVYKQNFDFSAAHFITYAGRCENLHGHNYRVEVALSGGNGPDAYLYNFSDLKPLVRRECDRLDHRMLLATRNALLILKEQGDEIEVRFGERRYVFPVAEVLLLPIENTTAELLAQYLLQRIKAELEQQARPELINLRRLEIMVEEQPGQAAYYAEEF